MANEISINASMSCTNGEFKLPTFGGAFNADQTTAGGGVPGQLNLTTAAETIDVSEITAKGHCWAKNVGSQTAFIGIAGGYGFQPCIEIPAGEACVFKMVSGAVYQAKAASSTTRLMIAILDR